MAEMIPPPEWGSGPNNPNPPAYLRRRYAERRAEASRKPPATLAALQIVGVLACRRPHPTRIARRGPPRRPSRLRAVHVHHLLGMLVRYSLWLAQVLDILVVLVGDRLWTYVPKR